MAVALEKLQAQVRSVAQPEEDVDALLEMAVQEFVTRRMVNHPQKIHNLHSPLIDEVMDEEERRRHQLLDELVVETERLGLYK